jgi:septal ring factor EnvC (AmiA/AmiB activator)
MLAFVCASSDFNEVVRRMKYLRTMRAMRKQQSEKIRSTHSELYHKIDLLNAERTGKSKLLAELSDQNTSLEKENKEANDAYKDMAGREKELQAELADKKKSAKRLNDAITAIIRQEMKHSEDAFRETHKPKPDEPDETEDTDPYNELPEHTPIIGKDEMAVARSFEKKKGSLAWPVDKGRVSCHFGKYNIKNIEYFNNGVDIRTVTYGIVKTVCDGQVSSVVEMDGRTIIIVQHGNYFTVYNNLMRGMVLKGQRVKAGQPLGLVGRNEEGFPTLNFQIWKSGGSKHETTMLNPEAWIRKGP